MGSSQIFRFSAAARAFVLAAITGPVLWTRDADALATLIAVALISLLAQATAWRPRFNEVLSTPVEAALIGAACGFALDSSLTVLAALVVPPFVAGLQGGVRGVARALSAQTIAIVATAFFFFEGLSAEASLSVFSWTVTGLGLGFIASFLRATMEEESRELAPYLYAQSLLRQLIDLSDGLSSGLEPISLGGSIMSAVRDELPTSAVAVYVPRGETLTALVSQSSEPGMSFEACEELAIEAWARTEPIVFEGSFAFPIGDSAVVAGQLSPRVEVTWAAITADIHRLEERLHAPAVHLDTALLFADFRDTATADERRRLAREMHDGVAQDIASLGYIVDALAARPATPKQGEQFAMLRERITHVVSEVRASVLTLRTSVGESESLGAAIGTVARHLSEVSGVPIQVRLDEHATRLRPEVEAELFRIAQEAMNNAIKHAEPTSIEVLCQVHAPDALVTVSDNGRGLQKARSDSHGLKIMRERAKLINGRLRILDNPEGGLIVSVCVPSSADARLSPPPRAESVTT
ncbi:hypothetical protein GCM10027020_00770 [Nocardioides salsibiostraticola]